MGDPNAEALDFCHSLECLESSILRIIRVWLDGSRKIKTTKTRYENQIVLSARNIIAASLTLELHWFDVIFQFSHKSSIDLIKSLDFPQGINILDPETLF
jgi:hypothetical protein